MANLDQFFFFPWISKKSDEDKEELKEKED